MNKDTIVNFCFWMDLLGFSKPFVDSNWDLDNPIAQKNLDRIISLQRKFIDSASQHREVALLLNDGICRAIDVELFENCIEEYSLWLNFTMLNFISLNMIDINNENPGARAVFASGKRFGNMSNVHFTDPRFGDRKTGDIYLFSPHEFQMNLAFSKAYLIESLGSRFGIKGARLYFDKSFLDEFCNLVVSYSSCKGLAKEFNYQATMPCEENGFEFTIHRSGMCHENIVIKLFFDPPISIDNDRIKTEVYSLIRYQSADDGCMIDARRFRGKTNKDGQKQVIDLKNIEAINIEDYFEE